MFGCNQDTRLLQNALVSAAKNNSGHLQKLDKELKEEILYIITKSLKTIIEHCMESNESSDSGRKEIEFNIYMQQRLHAAVFYNVLRSYDITSDSASIFYGSVSYRWPSIDFDFYVELNYRENWSELFIECASQLPEKILLIVLKHILRISFQSHLKYYLWHLTLQSILQKLMKITAPDVSDCSFNFDFECKSAAFECSELDSSSKRTCNSSLFDWENINCLKDIYNVICNELTIEVQLSCDRSFICLILHAVKTLMKYKHKFCCKELLRVYEVLDHYLSSNSNIEVLKDFINSQESFHISSEFTTTAWSIPVNYLIVVINFYYNSLVQEEILNLKNILECSEIPLVFPVILSTISPYLKHDFHDQNDLHLELLFKMIDYKLEGARYAAEVLLSNLLLLEQDVTLKVLEDNSCVIDFQNVYPLMLESIQAVKCPESKARLLKLFYRILSSNPVELYNHVLKHILNTYGLTKTFQLPDYDEQVSLLVRQASSVKNVDLVLLSLFIQSPDETLKSLIEEVLSQGEAGKSLIQVLKLIPQACTYSIVNHPCTCLIEILLDYIQRDKLEEYECKNFPVLFDMLMKVHLKTKILDLNLFITKCAIPFLKKSGKILLILPCLKAIFQHLCIIENATKEKKSEVSVDRKLDIHPDTMKLLVSSVGLLINSAVKSGSGRSKESYLSLFNEIENYQIATKLLNDYHKKEIQTIFLRCNEVVLVYAKEFLPKLSNYKKKLTTLWIWCCKASDFTLIENKFSEGKISYLNFLNTLVQLVPHFTVDEWKLSLNFAENLKKYDYFIEDAVKLFDTVFQLSDSNLRTYAVIHSFIVTLHITLADKVNESLYTSSCFCNILGKKIKEDVEPSTQLIMAIFLDLCGLINSLEPDIIPVFSSVLFELKDCMSLHINLTVDCDYNKLIFFTLKCLPDSSEKDALLQKMKIFNLNKLIL